MEKNYTKDEVINIIIHLQLYSNANNNQSLKDIKGANFIEKAEHILNAFEDANRTENYPTFFYSLKNC